MSRLIIIGAGGHGKVAADIARLVGYEDIAFLDDNDLLKGCMGYSIIGKTSEAEKHKDCDFFVAIGNAKIREKVQKNLQSKGLKIVTLIHPNATIADTVSVGKGTVIMAGAVINPDSRIGDSCIINTGATVDHDNVTEDYVHVSVGAHIAGTVHIGRGTWIGIGAVISNNIDICGDCMIGAGAVVIKSIDESGTYAGIPARKLRDNA